MGLPPAVPRWALTTLFRALAQQVALQALPSPRLQFRRVQFAKQLLCQSRGQCVWTFQRTASARESPLGSELGMEVTVTTHSGVFFVLLLLLCFG